jgi:pilus assembly protein CpaC
MDKMKSAHKHSTTLLVSLILTLFSFFAVAQEDEEPRSPGGKHEIKYLSLSVGIFQDLSLPLAPNEPTPSGTFRGYLDVKWDPEGKVLRIYPKREGNGTLIIQEPKSAKILYEFRFDVKKSNLYNVAREIRSLLSDIDGITIRIVNNRVIVDGQILLPKDMNRIHSVVKQYNGLAGSLVTLSPIAQAKIAELIERDINNPEIHIRAVNGRFILEGVAGDAGERDKAEIIAKTYVPDVIVDEAEADKKLLKRKVDVVINLITVKERPPAEPDKIISITVHYVELQKDYSKSFRFQWTPDIGDQTQVQFQTGGDSPGGVVSTITGTISNLLPKLNWAKQHGFARVLQSSTVIVQDRKEGVLNNIQRLPYQIVNDKGQPSTNFEEAGLRTSLTPEVQGARSDSIKLTMRFSIKSLISYTPQGPTTSSSEIQTVLVIRSGQSAAVGGLISSDSGTNYNKLPPNVSANPLISLYASKDFRKNKSQFVVFVTPSIRSSASAGAEQIKRKFKLKD